MVWKEKSMEQARSDFIDDVMKDDDSFNAICQRYGISRKTGYKWYSRFVARGKEGLKDLSRAPQTHPNKIDPSVAAAVIEIKKQYRFWGPRKIHARLKSHYPEIALPCKSSVDNILRAENLICPRSRRRRVPATAPLGHCEGINDIWCYDFKGWFLTEDGRKCEPLTISDAHSRFLLKCVHLNRKNASSVWEVFDQAFREYGLPLRVRSDNGPPFATTGVGRLSKLSIMLLKAGVIPEWIAPGKPQENGRHERIHLTLKKEVASPPAKTLSGQIRAMRDFQEYYNYERPHEALDLKPPASVYAPSHRVWDGRLRSPEYDDSCEKRKVMKCGSIAWMGRNYFLSETLYGEYIALKQTQERLYSVFYGPILLGQIDFAKGFARPK